MRSSLSGSIATCLIFVPLVAVPLLAVLGMPQLSASTPTVAADDLKLVADEPLRAGANSDLLAPVRISDSKSDAGGEPSAPRTSTGQPDPFAEFTREAESARKRTAATDPTGQSRKRPQRWLNEGNGLPQKALLSLEHAGEDHAAADAADQARAGGSIDDRSAEQPANGVAKSPAARRALPEAEAVVALDSESSQTSASADARRDAEPRSPGTSQAWKQAVGRLNALGIRDFELQPGERAGEFNFSCRFASRANPRVIHRFEADAADPLEAVNHVLRQLDDWRARHAERGESTPSSETERKVTSRAADSSEVELTNRAF
jgi:hypothetical protein